MVEAKAKLGPSLEALGALATETSSSRRRELLREITDVFFAPAMPAQAVGLFDAALEKLADALEVELRADLAHRLASAVLIPSRLVSRLVGDPEDGVAEPILTADAALSEVDLLRAVAVGGQSRLRAASRRGDLTEQVSDRIVERGDDETLGVLVANPAAPLSRAASETVVDRAMVNPALHAVVVDRESLPADLLNEMYFTVTARLRDRIVARNARLDPALLEESLHASRDRMARRAGVLPPDHEEAMATLRRLPGGVASPQALVGFAREGRQTLFTAAIAQSADVDFETVRRVLSRRDFDALALVCRAGGFDAALFRTLALLLKAQDEAPVAEMVERFEALDGDTARRVLRFWKVRRTGALAAAA